MSMVNCPTHGIQYPDYFPASCPIFRQHSIDMAALERQIERRKKDIRKNEPPPEVRTWHADTARPEPRHTPEQITEKAGVGAAETGVGGSHGERRGGGQRVSSSVKRGG